MISLDDWVDAKYDFHSFTMWERRFTMSSDSYGYYPDGGGPWVGVNWQIHDEQWKRVVKAKIREAYDAGEVWEPAEIIVWPWQKKMG